MLRDIREGLTIGKARHVCVWKHAPKSHHWIAVHGRLGDVSVSRSLVVKARQGGVALVKGQEGGGGGKNWQHPTSWMGKWSRWTLWLWVSEARRVPQ